MQNNVKMNFITPGKLGILRGFSNRYKPVLPARLPIDDPQKKFQLIIESNLHIKSDPLVRFIQTIHSPNLPNRFPYSIRAADLLRSPDQRNRFACSVTYLLYRDTSLLLLPVWKSASLHIPIRAHNDAALPGHQRSASCREKQA